MASHFSIEITVYLCETVTLKETQCKVTGYSKLKNSIISKGYSHKLPAFSS